MCFSDCMFSPLNQIYGVMCYYSWRIIPLHIETSTLKEVLSFYAHGSGGIVKKTLSVCDHTCTLSTEGQRQLIFRSLSSASYNWTSLVADNKYKGDQVICFAFLFCSKYHIVENSQLKITEYTFTPTTTTTSTTTATITTTNAAAAALTASTSQSMPILFLSVATAEENKLRVLY